MAHGLVRERLGPVFQTPQGERFRRREVANAMLVVNGERLAGLTSHVTRTALNIEELSPVAGRIVVGARTAPRQGERTERVHVYRRGGYLRAQLDGAQVRFLCARVKPAA